MAGEDEYPHLKVGSDDSLRSIRRPGYSTAMVRGLCGSSSGPYKVGSWLASSWRAQITSRV